MTYDDGDHVLVRFETKEAETQKAVLLDGVWFPKSQVAHVDEDTGEAWVRLWFAEKEGLDYE